MRLPNGYGSITKMTDKARRNPYRVRKLIGYKDNDKTRRTSPVYLTIGYYPTRKAALEALAAYNANPVDVPERSRTLADVHAEWLESEKRAGKDSKIYYNAAWNHLSVLHSRRFADLRPVDYETILNSEQIARTARMTCRYLLGKMYRYAVRREYVDKDYAAMLDVIHDTETRMQRELYAPEDVNVIRGLAEKGIKGAVAAMIGLFTGFRPSEIITLTLDNVNMKERFFQAGMKTKNGKNRLVPILPDIFPYVEEMTRKAAKFEDRRLFHGYSFRQYEYFTMHGLSEAVKTPHRTHDTRHAFATYAKRSGMDPASIKRIMGHSLKNDITEAVYTHAELSDLRREMNKYKIV